MANNRHIAILRRGVQEWNAWRKLKPAIRPDLGSGMEITPMATWMPSSARSWQACRGMATSFSHRELDGIDFSNADLTFVNFAGTSLKGANFGGAQLILSDFTAANLTGADLSNAHIRRARFEATTLDGANFHNAFLAGALFVGCDLSSACNLHTCSFSGPSHLDQMTVTASNNLSVKFLRGCGFSDLLIDYLPSLTTGPIQFYSCFISCSKSDRELAERLYDSLQNNGVRCWYFAEDATWGKPVWQEIDGGIRVSQKVIVICSEISLQSRPVLREIERALQREDRENQEILFPIRTDDFIFDAWQHPRRDDVTSKVVGDFRRWDTDFSQYSSALRSLLKGIQRKQ